MKTFIISCFYQCLVARDCWPIDETYQVQAETEQEAINKVIAYLYQKEWGDEAEDDEQPTLEHFSKYSVTIHPNRGEDGLYPDVTFSDEEGYVIQISKLINL